MTCQPRGAETPRIYSAPRERAAVNRAGAALVQLPLPYLAQDLAEGRLETVLDDYAAMPIDGFYLYYPASRQPRPALKVLVDFLRAARASSPRSDVRQRAQRNRLGQGSTGAYDFARRDIQMD